MANLEGAVNATEPLWTISADLDDDIDYLTVEDEVVKVTANFPSGRDPQTLLPVAPRIRVERGASGTTAASHADGTALSPLIPPSVGGGGEQTIRLLGPYTFDHDEPGLTDWPGMPFFGPTLDSGTIVLETWGRMSAAWAGAGDMGIQIGVAPTDDPDNGASVLDIRARTGGNTTFYGTGAVEQFQTYSHFFITDPALEGAIRQRSAIRVVTPCQFYINNTAASSAGQIVIYALIAVPA